MIDSYFAPGMSAKYCDRHVCMPVYPLAYVKTTCSNFAKLFVHVTFDRGSVLLRRQCNTLCTSGFVDDIMFSHNGANKDTGLESATKCLIHRNSSGGEAELRALWRSLLSPIALFSETS